MLRTNRIGRLLVGTLVTAFSLSVASAQESGKAAAGKAPAPKDDKPAAGAEIGKPAPDFTLNGTDGKTYKLADLKDKVVVLEWINRDCPVCKAQEPKLKETASALQKKGVIWLAVDSTAAHKLADNTDHVKKAGLPYPILDDSAGTVGRAYGAKCTPTMYVISKGVLAYSGALIPQGEGSRNYVSDAVEELLAGKTVSMATTKAYGCSVKYKND